jgi:hypothetical protein
LTVGCSDEHQVAQVTALQKKADDLDAEIKTLKASMAEMERKQAMEELTQDTASVAYLTLGAQGYSIIQSDLGYLTVQLANLEAYANGTRVTLRFGNVTSATINGAKATLEWGRVDDSGAPKNDEEHSREVIFAESLRAGAWTQVRVVLDGVAPQEFGFVRVRDLSHSGIVLFR